MKVRASIHLRRTALPILFAVLVWHSKQPAKAAVETNTSAVLKERIASAPDGRRVEISAVTPALNTNRASVTDSNVDHAEEVMKQYRKGLLNKGQAMKEILSALNDVPINFYGKVEDQFSNAVANAAVNFSIRIYNGTESTVKRGQVMADDKGFFSITGYKAQDLGLGPQKAGYVLATADTFFKYSHLEEHPYASDPKSPTVIRMWKLQGAEPLLGINQHYKIPFTAAPIYFDLLASKIVPSGGDLKLMVNRLNGSISGQNPQDWGFTVWAVDGGLMKSSEQPSITYQAPESGYHPSDMLTASSNRHGIGVIQQDFFVQSRNGQVYSKIDLTFGINSTPDGFMSITFGGVANTNGSRNWEATASQ